MIQRPRRSRWRPRLQRRRSGAQRGDAARLFRQIGQREHLEIPEAAGATGANRAGLKPSSGFAPVALLGGRRRDAVHDQPAHGNSRAVERRERVGGLLQGHRLRQRDPGHLAGRRIAQHRRQRFPVALQLDDQSVRGIPLVRAAQRGDHRAVMGLQGVEHAGDAAEQRRSRQQAQRVPGRRRVHDDLIEPLGHSGDLEQADDFVDARQRKLQQPRDVFVVQVGPAQRNRRQQLAPRRQPAVEGRGGVEAGGVQVPRPFHRFRMGSDAAVQDGRERGGGVGRDEECAGTLPLSEQSESKGRRRIGRRRWSSRRPPCRRRT